MMAKIHSRMSTSIILRGMEFQASCREWGEQVLMVDCFWWSVAVRVLYEVLPTHDERSLASSRQVLADGRHERADISFVCMAKREPY